MFAIPCRRIAARPCVSPLTLLATVLLIGTATDQGVGQTPNAEVVQLPPGTKRATLSHGGLDRTYFYRLPANRETKRPRPLLVFLHPLGMDGAAMAAFPPPLYGDHALAEDLVTIFPCGIDNAWNDTQIRVSSADDIGFLDALISHSIRELGADPERVYLFGISNGGVLAHMFACRRPARVAAVAAVIGAMPRRAAKEYAHAMPVPIMLINGDKDPVVRWEGGPIQLEGPTGDVLSVDDNVRYWRTRNQCTSAPRVTACPDRTTTDGSSVVRSDYRGRAPVVLLRVKGGGHALPTMDPIARQAQGSQFGSVNGDIEALKTAVEFMLRYKRVEGRSVRVR